ncbi:MAG: nitroreductase/quinone reductase family protein [Phototrophicaceae bacterium]|jgi:hypothetical protein
MAETFFYMQTVGWKSGNAHTIEIWFVEYDGCYYLCAEHREAAHWVKNVIHQPSVQYRLGESKTEAAPLAPATAQVIRDEEQPAKAAAVKALLKAKYNWDDGLLVEVRVG